VSSGFWRAESGPSSVTPCPNHGSALDRALAVQARSNAGFVAYVNRDARRCRVDVNCRIPPGLPALLFMTVLDPFDDPRGDVNSGMLEAWAAVLQAIAAFAALGVSVLLYKVTKQYVEHTKHLVEGSQLQAEAAKLIIMRDQRDQANARNRYVSALLAFARQCTGMRMQLESDSGTALYADGTALQMKLAEISSSAHDVGAGFEVGSLIECGGTMLKNVIGFPLPAGERSDVIGSLRAIETEVHRLLHFSDSETWPSDSEAAARFVPTSGNI
jgi:hypothetical protein